MGITNLRNCTTALIKEIVNNFVINLAYIFPLCIFRQAGNEVCSVGQVGNLTDFSVIYC